MMFHFLVTVHVPDAWSESGGSGGREFCETALGNMIDGELVGMASRLPVKPGFTNGIEVSAVDFESDGDTGAIGEVRPIRSAN